MTSKSTTPPGSGAELVSPLAAEVFRQAVEVAPVPMIVARRDGSIAIANAAAVALFGFTASELTGEPVERLIPECLHAIHRKHRDEYASNPETRPMGAGRDLKAVTRDGTQVPVEIGLSPVETTAGMVVICAILDLTLRKKHEEELAGLAALLVEKNQELLELVATDSLTSLRSRRAFLDHLAGQLETAIRYSRPLSILILDIDHFKPYNDQFGHLAGDEVLRQFGHVLKETARRSDFVARLGGEEFGIVLPETDAAGARTIAERFRKAIEAATWPEREITASVGAMTVTFDQSVPRPAAPDISRLLSEADRALYASKEGGRNRITHASDLPPE